MMVRRTFPVSAAVVGRGKFIFFFLEFKTIYQVVNKNNDLGFSSQALFVMRNVC